jgi:cysteine synthase A
MSQPARRLDTMPAPGRGRIYDSITETIGETPLVRLDKIARAEGVGANLLAKLEFFNPIASVKDRIGVAMIEAMERDGRFAPARPRWSSRPPAIRHCAGLCRRREGLSADPRHA